MRNSNIAKIFLNSKLVKAHSKTFVKSIIFTREVAKNYELPLIPSSKGIPIKVNLYKENMAQAEVE